MRKYHDKTARWEHHSSRSSINVPGFVMLGYDRFTVASPLFGHRHDNLYEFVYVESGKVTWEIDRAEYPSHTGQFFYTHPNEWHRPRFNHIEPCSIWWMMLENPLTMPDWLHLPVKDLKQLQESLDTLPRIISVDTRVREVFRKLRFTLDHPRPYSELFIRHLILDIIFFILDPPSSRTSPDSLTQLTEELKHNPERRWTNEELAVKLNISESNLYRLFRDVFGQSPGSFMERLRIEQAGHMLRDTTIPITSIALDLGYQTSQHFSTVFKRYTGMTPSQLRSSG